MLICNKYKFVDHLSRYGGPLMVRGTHFGNRSTFKTMINHSKVWNSTLRKSCYYFSFLFKLRIFTSQDFACLVKMYRYIHLTDILRDKTSLHMKKNLHLQNLVLSSSQFDYFHQTSSRITNFVGITFFHRSYCLHCPHSLSPSR
jgi:hypothetical protein